jgi:hypothetical protein
MSRTVAMVAALAGVITVVLYSGFGARWGEVLSPASVALAAPSCDCPEQQCANGKVAGCTVTCPAGQDAVCACDGFCDANGNPGGLNRCACQ